MNLNDIFKNAKKSSFDGVKDGAFLEKDLFEAKQKTPNEHDGNAEMFKAMGETIRDPNLSGPQRALSGLARGLEAGSRSSSIFDRQEDLAKFNKVMDYLGAVNKEMTERHRRLDKEDDLKQKLMPEVSAYLQTAKEMTPQTRSSTLRSLVDQYNQAIRYQHRICLC